MSGVEGLTGEPLGRAIADRLKALVAREVDPLRDQVCALQRQLVALSTRIEEQARRVEPRDAP